MAKYCIISRAKLVSLKMKGNFCRYAYVLSESKENIYLYMTLILYAKLRNNP